MLATALVLAVAMLQGVVATTPNKVTKKKFETPVSFTNIGNIVYSGRHYVVPVYLQVQDLLEMIQPIEAGLSHCREVFNALTASLGGKSKGRSNDHVTKFFHIAYVTILIYY